MRNMRILAALGLLATTAAANADVSGTAAIVSDYDFRGFTQTAEDPALQISIDYATEIGWYAGIWGSNIGSFVDYDGLGVAETEVDVYTGFRGSAGDLGWDAGLTYYTYPGASDLNYFEIYGKLTYSVVTGSVYYSNDFAGLDTLEDDFAAIGVKTGDAFYIAADAAIPAGPLTINLHAGLSQGDGIEALLVFNSGVIDGLDYGLNSSLEDSYIDYSIGVTYPVNGFNLGFKWISFDAGDAGSDDRVILSLSTAFPWAD